MGLGAHRIVDADHHHQLGVDLAHRYQGSRLLSGDRAGEQAAVLPEATGAFAARIGTRATGAASRSIAPRTVWRKIIGLMSSHSKGYVEPEFMCG